MEQTQLVSSVGVGSGAPDPLRPGRALQTESAQSFFASVTLRFPDGEGALFIECSRQGSAPDLLHLHIDLGEGGGRARRVVRSEGSMTTLGDADSDWAWRHGRVVASSVTSPELHVADRHWGPDFASIRAPTASFEWRSASDGEVEIIGDLAGVRFDLTGFGASGARGWVEIGGRRREVVDGVATRVDDVAAVTLVGPPHARVFISSLARWIDLGAFAEMDVRRSWLSGRTFQEYPVDFAIDLPGRRLRVSALYDNQEANLLRTASRWAGACHVIGDVGARKVDEVGFLVLCPKDRVSQERDLLADVNSAVSNQVADVLSWPISACPAMHPGLDPGVLPAELHDLDLSAVLAPVREIAERGGKGWRGYTIAICCEAAGGEFSAFRPWLALTEILHVGSLIVDDVEDNALVRRGGPASHLIHGVPLAVNAGSLAYFLAMSIIERTTIDSGRKSSLYGEYETILRLAHVGQALDLALANQPREALRNLNELGRIEARARYANRLKSAVPFRGFARMGALLADAESATLEALGDLFLATGEAFQLLDDVLNIQGFPGSPGKRGEDIRNGKLTLPVIRAFKTLDAAGRRRAFEAFDCAAGDVTALDHVCAIVEGSGELELCMREIQQVAERDTARACRHLDDPHAAYTLTEFVHQVLSSHY